MSGLFRAILLQFSGTIGSGIFVLPYLFATNSFSTSILILFITSIIVIFLNLFYADIILSTKGDHQLVGYAFRYLGHPGKVLSLFSLILLGFGAVLVHSQLFSRFLLTIFPSSPPFLPLTVFTLLLLTAHYLRGHKLANNIFQYSPLLTIALVIYIFFSSFSSGFSLPTVAPGFGLLGAILFAVNGFTVIPEVEEILRHDSAKKIKVYLSLIISSFLIFLTYSIFSYAIIRISGPYLSSDSVTGLYLFRPQIALILSILALTTTFKSSLNFLLVFNEIFHRDFLKTEKKSYLLSLILLLPPVLFSRTSLLEIISFTGAVTISISTAIICLIRLRLRHNLFHKIIVLSIFCLFILGIYFYFR